MSVLMKFSKGVRAMPLPWQLWLMCLGAMNLVVPFFFLERIEARIVLGVFLAGALLMLVLTALSGFTRLLGLGHILWFPLLYFLWTRLGEMPADGFFGIWVRALIGINATSLAIDVVDVIRYVAGDRAESV